MTTPRQIEIERAAKLICAEERWCRDSYARNGDGHGVMFDSPNAIRWCAVGARLRVGYFQQVITSDFNDTHTHREVWNAHVAAHKAAAAPGPEVLFDEVEL